MLENYWSLIRLVNLLDWLSLFFRIQTLLYHQIESVPQTKFEMKISFCYLKRVVGWSESYKHFSCNKWRTQFDDSLFIEMFRKQQKLTDTLLSPSATKTPILSRCMYKATDRCTDNWCLKSHECDHSLKKTTEQQDKKLFMFNPCWNRILFFCF